MALSTILIVIGILCVIASFFLKDTSKKLEQDVEDLSIQFYQEMNGIKRRLKAVEEELLLDSSFKVKPAKNSADFRKTSQAKPVNQILVQQVIELNKQGCTVEEICKMSTLTKEQVLHILQQGGRR
ncbi:hypothetical protein NST62_05420 [Ureibacillus sp. FSL K6-8385]|uniref:DUF2802 domain-containing protein n=1 Tax=Ureibacillus terrenus TaxID=118246 RepID=A0A540V6C6_9BACL|nr:hypothetical protein [Ureibacillus terrenus]MED3660729.1 hypothetical protein [Ureibacillus terrenus]MED3762916.1 hypothetical protein [Ureibacillus terrenus]TQE92282.1 hypothetical protein FKZ59_00820 [Ureibacillus terrenus]